MRLAPAASTLKIRPAIPLRIIGLEDSGIHAALDRLWPFGVSTGVIDRVRTGRVVHRHPTLYYVDWRRRKRGPDCQRYLARRPLDVGERSGNREEPGRPRCR